ncbi:Multicopper oxidase LPR1 [Bienertia sinuspersici]
MWYHDHAMGLTRANLLAGLLGSYIVRHPHIEDPLGLPSGHQFDRVLVVCDRDFYRNGSIYMNTTGNNPHIHPQWQPEYFGNVIVVNGKAWPYMEVQRRKYRFRIINTSNARFFRFYLRNGLPFIHVASDSAYIRRPIIAKTTLVAPSEISDVVIDFSKSKSNEVILANDAVYPFPSGDPVNNANSKVMKFIIRHQQVSDPSKIPKTLIKYPSPNLSSTSQTRYISMYEYTSKTDEPTHLLINGLSFDAPVTETPKVGSTEIWYVINLTEDNHPLHVHLGLFKVLKQTHLLDFDKFHDCMVKINDAQKCNVHSHARGYKLPVPKHERGWKNVYKMSPGYMTMIYVRFSYIHVNNVSYPFDATKDPGYVYHCHILDHEDNVMMRPFKLVH